MKDSGERKTLILSVVVLVVAFVAFVAWQLIRDQSFFGADAGEGAEAGAAGDHLKVALGTQEGQVLAVGGRGDWRYLSDRTPLVRGTPFIVCALGLEGVEGVDCKSDEDRDGYILEADCDDKRADVHPGAEDVPLNGLDEDCDGRDAGEPNIVLILLPGFGAASVGGLGRAGVLPEVTPAFDKLAEEGLGFRSIQAGAPSTRGVISAVLTGLPGTFRGAVEAERSRLSLRPVTRILSDHGYKTALRQDGGALDEALKAWFDEAEALDGGVVYDEALAWADAEQSPFMLTLVPRGASPPWTSAGGPIASPSGEKDRYLNAMAAADAELGRFMSAARSRPWSKKTWFIIAGTHGHLPEVGGDSHRQPFVWVPLAILGPELPVEPGDREALAGLAGSHLDLAPTLLDLVGIRAPHHFIGRTLLAKGPDGRDLAMVASGKGEWFSLRRGDVKTSKAAGVVRRFDLSSDTTETNDVYDSQRAGAEHDAGLIEAWFKVVDHLSGADLLWEAGVFEATRVFAAKAEPPPRVDLAGMDIDPAAPSSVGAQDLDVGSRRGVAEVGPTYAEDPRFYSGDAEPSSAQIVPQTRPVPDAGFDPERPGPPEGGGLDPADPGGEPLDAGAER